MHQLIYTSKARPELSQDDVLRIVEQSARNNPSGEITGFLLFQNGRFLQFIEGPLMALEMLMAELAQDSRHHALEVLCRRPVAGRLFPRWRMRQVGIERDALEELEQALRSEDHGWLLPEAVHAFARRTVEA